MMETQIVCGMLLSRVRPRKVLIQPGNFAVLTNQ